MLALRCGSILYGTTAVQYRLSAVWALSAAVRPAFAVLIYAPKLGYPRPRLKTFSRFVYTHVLKLCYTTIMREEALPVPEKKNLVPFPRSAKKRKQLLRQAESLKLRRLTRLRSFVGWLLVASIILFGAVNFTMFSPSSLRQTFHILTSALGPNSGRDGVIEYPSGSASTVKPVGSALAVQGDEALHILQLGDITQQEVSLSYASPVLETNDNYILTYDRGAYDLAFHSTLAELFTLKLSAPIRNASIGSGDSFVVITDETGYKSTVTVYGASSREDDHHLWRWRTPDYYVQEAVLSPSGTHLCAMTYQQNGAQLETILQFFDLDADQVRASVNLGAVVGYAVHWLDDSNVAVVTDQLAFTVSRRGQTTSQTDYTATDLLGFAFDDDNFVLAQRSWSGDARASITRYDKSGAQRAALNLPSAPESISYAGGQLGVLTSSGLYVYNNALEPDWKCTSGGAAQRVMLTDDGGAWLLYSKYAQRVTKSSTLSEDFTDDTVPV